MSLDRLKINQKSYNLPNSAFWGWPSVERQPQNPEFRNNPENFHPCRHFISSSSIQTNAFVYINKIWQNIWTPNSPCRWKLLSSADNHCKQLGSRSGLIWMEPSCLILMVKLIDFFGKKILLTRICRRQKCIQNYPAWKRVKVNIVALIYAHEWMSTLLPS